jgi:hypothetical protein
VKNKSFASLTSVLRSIVQVENGLLDYCWNLHVEKKVAIYAALEGVNEPQYQVSKVCETFQ